MRLRLRLRGLCCKTIEFGLNELHRLDCEERLQLPLLNLCGHLALLQVLLQAVHHLLQALYRHLQALLQAVYHLALRGGPRDGCSLIRGDLPPQRRHPVAQLL